MNTKLYNELVHEARKDSLARIPPFGSISDREVLNAEREMLFNEMLIEATVRHCAQIVFDSGETYSNALLNSIGSDILEAFELDDRFQRGSRVQVIQGFNVGAHGVVEFVEPTGRVWVLRDGASKPVYYESYELVFEDA